MMGGLSLIGINGIWLLSLVCLLMRIRTSILRYTGNLSFKQDHINHFVADSSPCTTTELSILVNSLPHYD